MTMRECPNCAEEIKEKAKVCIHCWKDVKKKITGEEALQMFKLIMFTVFAIYIIISFSPSWEVKSLAEPNIQQK